MNLIDHINAEFTIKSYNNPYKIWIIDNFLNKETLKIIYKYWPKNEDNSWTSTRKKINGKENILEKGMLSISILENIPEEIRKIFLLLKGKQFISYIQKLLEIKELSPDPTMNWSGLRVMLPNSKQMIHSDARIHPVSKERKEATCLLYLNKNYKKFNDEGCLEIWCNDMKKCVHKIEPLENRLVLFLNSEKSYHGVPLVKSERKSITWSINSVNSSLSERSKALFVTRPNDDPEIGILGLERSLVK